jgi:hypothetical protein
MADRRAVIFAASLLLTAAPPARAQSTAALADVQRVISQVQSEDRVQKVMGAIAAQHVVKQRWRFNLLDTTRLRWWQQGLLPAIPSLVQMLADDGGLEWMDQNGNTEQVTTPRKEALLALVALERASVAPLIAVLDRPELTRKSDEVLRRITGGAGPGDPRPASWQRWWQDNQGGPLPHEHGQLGKAALVLLLLAGAVTAAFFLQRKLATAGPRRPALTPSQ